MRFLDRVVARAIDAGPIMRPRRASTFEPYDAERTAFTAPATLEASPAAAASPAAPSQSAASPAAATQSLESARSARDSLADAARQRAQIQPVTISQERGAHAAFATPLTANGVAVSEPSVASRHAPSRVEIANDALTTNRAPSGAATANLARNAEIFPTLHFGQSEAPLHYRDSASTAPAASSHGVEREVREPSGDALPATRSANVLRATNDTARDDRPVDDCSDIGSARATPSEDWERNAPTLRAWGQRGAADPQWSAFAAKVDQARPQATNLATQPQPAPPSDLVLKQKIPANPREAQAVQSLTAGVHSHPEKAESILVSIGTIEVRQPAPRAAPAPPPPPRRTLDAYLARRAQAKNR